MTTSTKRNTIIYLAVLGLVVITMTSLGSAAAFSGGSDLTQKDREILEEARTLRQNGNRQAAMQLLEDNDLDALHFRKFHGKLSQAQLEQYTQLRQAIDDANAELFFEVAEGTPMADLTEDQFYALVAANEMREAGNHDEAKAILGDAGITKDMMPGQRHRRARLSDEAKQALDNEDFSTFVELTGKTNMTEEQFEFKAELYDLRQAGDSEAARELMQEAGMERPNKGLRRGGATTS